MVSALLGMTLNSVPPLIKARRLIKIKKINETDMPRRLPTVTYKGKKYYIDWRLKQFRPVEPPLEFISFDSELGRKIGRFPRAYTRGPQLKFDGSWGD